MEVEPLENGNDQFRKNSGKLTIEYELLSRGHELIHSHIPRPTISNINCQQTESLDKQLYRQTRCYNKPILDKIQDIGKQYMKSHQTTFNLYSAEKEVVLTIGV